MTIEVEQITSVVDGQKRSRTVWGFRCFFQFPNNVDPENSLVIELIEYRQQERLSNRHKWANTIANPLLGKTPNCWHKHQNRDHWNGYGMKPEDVPFPDWVKVVAINQVESKIKFKGAQ